MSGYGEASGNLIFKADENLREKLMASDSIDSKAIEVLFEHYGINPEPTKNMGFGVNNRQCIGEYVHLDIFDGSWIEIAKLLIQTKTENEVVGEFWDDYGGVYYVAKNGSGNTINFYFEEESEEMDQDDFDYEKNKEKWTAMIPKIAKGIFE